MFCVEVSRIVDCSRDTAFAFMTNLENDTRWWTGCEHATRTSVQERGVGTTFHEVNTLLCIRDHTDIVVTEYEEPKRMVSRTNSGRVPFVAIYLFEPVGARTKVTMKADVGVRGVLRLLGPLLRVVLRSMTERRFDRLESVLCDLALQEVS